MLVVLLNLNAQGIFDMPYTIRKQKCKQSDGDSGNYVLSYTDKKGKKHSNCHTSRKKAQGQIAAIEGPREVDETGKSSAPVLESLLRQMIRKIFREVSRSQQ